MTSQQRFAELWTDYLEGDLSDADLAELQALLAADESLQAQAADLFQTHRLLGLALQESDATAEAFTRATIARLPKTENVFVDSVLDRVRPAMMHGGAGKPYRLAGLLARRHPTLVSLVALVVVSLTVLAFVVSHHPRPNPAGAEQANDRQSPSENVEPLPEESRTSLLSQVPPDKSGFAANQVAMLTGIYNARWSGESPVIALGSRMTPGQEMHLEAGLAEITFKLGARIIIEAPAHVRTTSIDSLYVFSGKVTVRADTEPARGFVVKSSIARMLDLGTEFGAEIDEDSRTDLHVFQGMVEISRNSETASRAIRLTAGQRIVMRPQGTVEMPSRPADSNRFTRSLTIAKDDYRRWQHWSHTIRKDPDLIGCYTFEREPTDDRTLKNLAASGVASGKIQGACWGEGRWPGKSALRFTQPDDRVRLDVPGKFPALSMAAWVNLDGLDNEFNGLLLTDGWKERAGQCHWQLTRSGRMDFGINLSPADCMIYRSPSLEETDELGRWLHLAVVYDTAARQVCFYADGRQVNVKPITAEMPLVLGPCEIGNWISAPYSTFPHRSFHGRMDELLLFRRALSPADIKKIYEEGKP